MLMEHWSITRFGREVDEEEGGRSTEEDETDEDGKDTPRVYRVSSPRGAVQVQCPVGGVGGTERSHTNLRAHFVQRHPRPSITTPEGVSHPHPHLHHCDMPVSRLMVWTTHTRSNMCKVGAVQRQWRLAHTRLRWEEGVDLTAQGTPLEMVGSFQYLRRILTASDWTGRRFRQTCGNPSGVRQGLHRS